MPFYLWKTTTQRIAVGGSAGEHGLRGRGSPWPLGWPGSLADLGAVVGAGRATGRGGSAGCTVAGAGRHGPLGRWFVTAPCAHL